ncbi:MAG: hypothetical protein LUC22_07360, partial [Prevotella sp.]|nr:hypothetical protein [Prevotella sp.]
YSPIYGTVKFDGIRHWGDGKQSIRCETIDNVILAFFTNGKYYDCGECMLFPSKEERDWAAWAKRKNDLPKGTVVLFSSNGLIWSVSRYVGGCILEYDCKTKWDYIIPLTPDLDMEAIADGKMPEGVKNYGTVGDINTEEK